MIDNTTKHCVTCTKELINRQTKYCSRICHNKNGNTLMQSYHSQKTRARLRKEELIESKGGKCQVCGYNRNISALCFHHVDPSQKELKLDSRMLSNTSLDRILKEVEKCQLLCHNCHMEAHHPDFQTA